MKKIEVAGLGVHVEIYRREDRLDELGMLREAEKALKREIIKNESRANNHISRLNGNNELPKQA